jgi:hypothetical protein
MLSVLSVRSRIRDRVKRFGDPEPFAARLVPAVTAVLAFAALGFLARFASNCPVGDEWHLLPEALRADFAPAWFFEHHNGHRFVLAKVLWIGSLRLTNYDFRAPMALQIGLLVAATLLLLATAKRVTGRLEPAALLLPALLLHWGHWFNWLMGYQIAFALPVLIGALFLWSVDRSVDDPRRAVRGAALAALLLPLNGGFGIVMAGPALLWLVYAARRFRSLRLFAVAVFGFAYLGFAVLTTPKNAPTLAGDFATIASASLEYLASGFGPLAFGFWSPARVLVSALAVAVFLAAFAALLRAIRDPFERLRAAGYFALLVGHGAVMLTIAVYRGATGERFVTPGALGLAVAVLALTRYGPAIGQLRWLGLAGAIALLTVNAPEGYRQGLALRSSLKTILADVARGTPALFLSGQYGGRWMILDPFGHNIAALRSYGVEPYAGLEADPPFTPRRIALPPGSRVPACDAAPFLPGGPPVPSLPLGDAPVEVLALRVRVEQTRPEAWHLVRLRWRDADGRDREATAFPAQFPGYENELVFRTTARPRAVRLESASPTGGLIVHFAEWLTPSP